MKKIEETEYLKPARVTVQLDASVDTIYRLVDEGVLPHVVLAVRGGRRIIRIPRSALAQALARTGTRP